MRSALKVLFNKNRRITKLAKALGIKLSSRRPRDSYMWDGRSIATGGQSVTDVLHDIAHWLIASPERRKVVDFGLGPGPESGLREEAYEARIRSNDSAEEEICASLLGISLEAAFGFDIRRTLEEHGWNNNSSGPEGDFWRVIKKLNDLKMLHGSTPAVMEMVRDK